MSPPQISVIVINFNGRRFLDELLTTLRAQTLEDFETLLVDNASSDNSPGYVRDNFHWVRVLPQDSNLGFSRAGNLGARQASGQYLAFLNTDLKLDRHWLEGLVSIADRAPDIAAVASKMRLYDRPRLLNGVGGAMNRLGYTWDRGMFEEDRGQYDHSKEVLFASAGAALFRRQAFLECGGFDEKFFMYHEDVDLGWRLWLKGHRILTAPTALVYHHFGGSTREAGGLDWRELLGERHNIRTLIKNYERPNLLRALRDLLLLRQKPARKLAQLRNFLWNLKLLPDTLGQRRDIQRQRLRSDDELKGLIVQSQNVPVRL